MQSSERSARSARGATLTTRTMRSRLSRGVCLHVARSAEHQTVIVCFYIRLAGFDWHGI